MRDNIPQSLKDRADRIKNWMQPCTLCGNRFSFKKEGTNLGKVTADYTCGSCQVKFDEPLEALMGIVSKDVLTYIRMDILTYCDKRRDEQ